MFDHIITVVISFISRNLDIVVGLTAVIVIWLLVMLLLSFRSQSKNEPSGAFYIVALIFPPLALLLIGQPFNAILCLLILPLWPLALIWSLLAVSEHNAKAARLRDGRLARMIAAATSAAADQRQQNQWPAMTE